MATALADLTIDQRMKIVRTYLKGELSAAALQTKWDITEQTFNDLFALYDDPAHPNDVGGAGLDGSNVLVGTATGIGTTGEAEPTA